MMKVAFQELPPLGFLGRQDVERSRMMPLHHHGYWAYMDDLIWHEFGGMALIPLMFSSAVVLYFGWCRKGLFFSLLIITFVVVTVIAFTCFVAGKVRADTTDGIRIERHKIDLMRETIDSEAILEAQSNAILKAAREDKRRPSVARMLLRRPS
mmetsp:Transcript_9286/g.29523  ORF Transcript_9286/g.29523 Transcript_9286/m.29523 type:complete len:153 (+) Transcript_9286:1162-1620(+)